MGGPGLIEKDRLTLPGMLQGRGYTTALFGKWHIGMTFLDKEGRPINENGLKAVRRIDYSRTIPDAIKLISAKAGKDESGGSSERTPAEEFKVQRSKTIKTAEALVRAFDDLNRLRKSAVHERTIAECQALIVRAKNWK